MRLGLVVGCVAAVIACGSVAQAEFTPVSNPERSGTLFRDGIAPAESKPGVWGYIDATRHWVIEPRFSSAEPLSDGLGLVCQIPFKTGKYGFVDKTGKFVIKPQFDRAESFSGGLALVEFYEVNPYGADGHSYHRITSAFGKSYTSKRAGFIDKTGKLVIPATFARAKSFSDGLAAVLVGDEKTGKWGYIDKAGSYVIKPTYEAAGRFLNGKAIGRLNGTLVLIDKQGTILSDLGKAAVSIE